MSLVIFLIVLVVAVYWLWKRFQKADADLKAGHAAREVHMIAAAHAWKNQRLKMKNEHNPSGDKLL